MKCRHCNAELTLPLVDLGSAPPSNAYLDHLSMNEPERWFPLRVVVCTGCWLVQTEDFTHADELFSPEYAYFSSFSNTWLEHAENYVSDMVNRFGLDSSSMVIEVGANDGYLLQYFKGRDIPCMGIEPTAGPAAAARDKGIEINEGFFGKQLAGNLSEYGWAADLMTANNVLAHVPDINDFTAGFATLLKTGGVATFEFPHLMKLIQGGYFDTIYHEHYSYLSFSTVTRIMERNGLDVFDVEEHETHGGSLRVYAQKKGTGTHGKTAQVEGLLQRERASGICTAEFYAGFQSRTNEIKNNFLSFLLDARRQGKRIAAYGAAAKGNT
jgi:hypothetical protein